MTTPNKEEAAWKQSLYEIINRAAMDRRVLIHKKCGRRVEGVPGFYGKFHSCLHCRCLTDNVEWVPEKVVFT